MRVYIRTYIRHVYIRIYTSPLDVDYKLASTVVLYTVYRPVACTRVATHDKRMQNLSTVSTCHRFCMPQILPHTAACAHSVDVVFL